MSWQLTEDITVSPQTPDVRRVSGFFIWLKNIIFIFTTLVKNVQMFPLKSIRICRQKHVSVRLKTKTTSWLGVNFSSHDPLRWWLISKQNHSTSCNNPSGVRRRLSTPRPRLICSGFLQTSPLRYKEPASINGGGNANLNRGGVCVCVWCHQQIG